MRSNKARVRICIEPGCHDPVATRADRIPGSGRRGSRYWCVKHEAQRLAYLDAQFKQIERTLDALAGKKETTRS